jgi:hypothetical protein
MRKWIKSRMRAMFLGVLVYVAAMALLVPLCGWLVELLVAWVSRLDEGVVDSLAIYLPLGLIPIVLGGLFGLLAFTTRRRGRWLDEIFEPLGLAGRSYGMSGRQYHGRYRGRQIDAYIYHGPGMLLYVGAQTATQLAAAAQDQMIPQLARLFNGPPLEHNQPGLEDIVIFAHDEAWARAFVAETAVQEALRRLIQGKTGFVFQQVHVRPDAIYLKLHRGESLRAILKQARQVTEWTEDVIRLAQEAERLPAPAEKLATGKWEERLQLTGLREGTSQKSARGG